MWVWPFELEEKIGEGGMGVVYRGRYVKNDRRVAVKLLPPEIADETVLARFEREVQLLKELRHPAIVHSFGGVCEDKRRFYAMELVEGGTLDELLAARGGRFPWEQVVEFGMQMCSALHYAHELGIVHRDVKPGNFLVTKKGKLKLSDFGLATLVSGSHLTSDGRTVGSFRFMSPEQVRGTKEPLPSSDLYSLGCVLFKMLAGRPPFDGDTAASLLNQHLTAEPPRVVAMVPDCPASLDLLVARLLNKKAEDRPESAKEVARLLKAVSPVTTVSGDTTKDITRPSLRAKLTREPAPVREEPPPRALGKITISLAVVTVISLAWAFMLLSSSSRQGEARELWISSYRKSGNSIEIRENAAKALGRLARHDSGIVTILKDGLADSDPRMQAASAKALGEAGGNAQSAVSALMALQRKNENPIVRPAVIQAISQIGSDPAPSSSWKYVTGMGLAAVIIVCGWYYYRKEQIGRG
jgi:eukaryotic-like serine/threonine-protein kinase